MAKSREHIIANGRAVFYACIYEDLKNAALDCGWALGLHGSLNSDMDLMAMKWTEEAKPVEELVIALERCLTPPDSLIAKTKKSTDKPNGRIVYTIHIFADFYLDVNIVSQEYAKSQNDEEKDRRIAELVDECEYLKTKKENFLDVLTINYQAQIAGFYNIDKTESERNARKAVMQEYQDLIHIYKHKNKQP